MELRKNPGKRIVRHQKDPWSGAALTVLIDREVPVELVKGITRVGRGLDAILVAVHGLIQVIQEMESLELASGIQVLCEKEPRRALRAAETAITLVSTVEPVSRQVHRGVIERTRAPEA